ncbi:hypothetical protein AB4Z10_25265 [Bosea sp. RAF48]|uniref:hypothetical protein n=1 Tax=Bosea sp. RAF48 TaxID=3237480 RepID=UPI003F8F6F4C
MTGFEKGRDYLPFRACADSGAAHSSIVPDIACCFVLRQLIGNTSSMVEQRRRNRRKPKSYG